MNEKATLLADDWCISWSTKTTAPGHGEGAMTASEG
jgi:hypothetical protein